MELKNFIDNCPGWEIVQFCNLPTDLINEPAHWCSKNLKYGTEFVVHISYPVSKYNTDWGTFNLDNTNLRTITFLFKNAKHATMFRLRWSSLIKES